MEINRENAQKMNVKDGDMIMIESTHDKMKLKAKTTSRVPEGIVFVSEDYEWVPVNKLRDRKYTNVKIVKA